MAVCTHPPLEGEGRSPKPEAEGDGEGDRGGVKLMHRAGNRVK
jgi:hypothetical protein